MHKAIFKNSEPLFLVGTSKNAGKTTALNFILDAYRKKKGARAGLVSIGIDGEKKDAIFGFSKPAIKVVKGELFATTRGALKECTCTHEIVAETRFGARSHKMVIARATSSGNILLIGPDRNSDLEYIIDALYKAGAKKVFVDGAFDRRTQTSLHRPSSLVLSVAPLENETMPVCIKRIKTLVAKYELSVIPAKAGIQRSIKRLDPCRSLPRDRIRGRDDRRMLHIKGAFTNSLFENMKNKMPRAIVVNDPSRIFLNDMNFSRLLSSSTKLYVANKIELKLITLRPSNEYGEKWDAKMFLKAVRTRVKGVTVVDIMKEIKK